MTISHAVRTTRIAGLLGAALVCLLFTASEDISMAGIQGSGFAYRMTARGHITQFGSIFVNGVEYDISGANIRIDGKPGSESALHVGQVVTVKGDVNAEATQGAAREVSATSAVVGPLAQVDLAGGTLVVLGQRIRLLPSTFLDQALNLGGLGGLLGIVPGINVRISGFPNAAGEIEATRVDLAIGLQSLRLTGIVQGLDRDAHTFRINSQAVQYGAVGDVEALANGATVTVQGNIPLLQTTLHATDIQVLSGIGGGADELGEVEGLITTFNSAADFTIESQRIVTDGNTVFTLRGQTLGPNLPVVVRGTFDDAGVLVASEVVATPSSQVGVLGAVESITNGVVRVLGVDFATTDATAFDDQSNQNVRPFGVGALHVGDLVEIRGGAAAGAVREAAAVKRADGATSYYVEGVATDLAAPSFRVLGVRVLTTPQTRYSRGGLLGALKFFAGGANQKVKVRGILSGQTLIAEEIRTE
ncbi:MAG TPA: DUF5666 domain-containing protein [Steroidobacteraceae bacterium]|nr:DUF5666 domain-containing protein [Steroidobacteraceae bacterium]